MALERSTLNIDYTPRCQKGLGERAGAEQSDLQAVGLALFPCKSSLGGEETHQCSKWPQPSHCIIFKWHV
ncbi:hypothetical protein Q8A67_017853 [Cirrhinus molitorella]|uniref:Uncharacterized protein n=1 Tax=Cirrhinus molitorella TaxID=172907 RepID=A0AA88TS26_9TELE|nr:hypothetical protein Q8A67_017853 [Cirrhinus molitorella]